MGTQELAILGMFGLYMIIHSILLSTLFGTVSALKDTSICTEVIGGHEEELTRVHNGFLEGKKVSIF